MMGQIVLSHSVLFDRLSHSVRRHVAGRRIRDGDNVFPGAERCTGTMYIATRFLLTIWLSSASRMILPYL